MKEFYVSELGKKSRCEMLMKNEKMLLYVQTSDNPERQYSPLVLAQTAKAMELEPVIYFLGAGLRILRPGADDEIKLGSFPSVKDMLDQTMQMGITVYVCEASKQMLGWDKVCLLYTSPSPRDS